MRPGHTNTLSPCYNYYTPPLKRARRGTAANVRTLQKGDRLRVWLYLGSSGPTPLSRTESDTVTDGGGGGGNDASNKGSSLRQYVVPRSLVQVLDAHNPAVTLSEDGTSITSRWSDAIFLRAFPRVKDGPQAIRAGRTNAWTLWFIADPPSSVVFGSRILCAKRWQSALPNVW